MALILGVQYGTPITSTGTYTGIPPGTILPVGNGVVISSMTTTGNPTTVTTATNHGLVVGDSVVISGTGTTPTSTLGIFTVATVPTATTFTIAVNVTGGTTAGVVSKIPTRTLFCDGSAVSRTTYATLWNTVGTSFGNGDGSTTFNLPDFRGRFLRGVDGSASNDPDKASRTAMNTGGNTGNLIGSVQGHQYASHNHGIKFYNGGPAGNNDGVVGSGNWQITNNNTSIAAGGNETRPLNAYVNYVIAF